MSIRYFAASFLVAVTSSAFGVTYTPQFIAVPNNLPASSGAISADGVVAFTAQDNAIPSSPQNFVYLWQNGQLTSLPMTVTSSFVRITGVNDSGTVVGVATSPGQSGLLTTIPVTWSPQQMTELPLGTFASGSANGVNNNGLIVGQLTTTSTFLTPGVSSPVSWNNGTLATLGDFGSNGGAVGVNNKGEVLILSAPNLYIQNQGNLTLVTDAIGPGNYFLNDADQVAYTTQNGIGTAFWQMGVASQLPGLPNSTGTTVFGMNNQGDVIGLDDVANNEVPVLWQNGSVVNLNSLIDAATPPTIDFPVGISDNGTVLVMARVDGQDEPLLLVPTPEPATALCLAGVFPLMAVKRCRQRG